MTRLAPTLVDPAQEELAADLAVASFALARRLDAGATLWCASPSFPHHAQHLAVEFVHPVIVGKPALPAVTLDPRDLTSTARVSVRPGDVLAAIGPADDPALLDLLRRSPAWGVMTIWIGGGERPPVSASDHVLWLRDGSTAAYDGQLILLYHLLWELTHVCLEHRGLLAAPPACDGPVCITCSDEGRLAEVVGVVGATARVRTADGVEDVDLALVEQTEPNDLLVVHAGMALTRLTP